MSEAQKRPGTLDIIEEITRKDGSTYYEIGNMVHYERNQQ